MGSRLNCIISHGISLIMLLRCWAFLLPIKNRMRIAGRMRIHCLAVRSNKKCSSNWRLKKQDWQSSQKRSTSAATSKLFISNKLLFSDFNASRVFLLALMTAGKMGDKTKFPKLRASEFSLSNLAIPQALIHLKRNSLNRIIVGRT